MNLDYEECEELAEFAEQLSSSDEEVDQFFQQNLFEVMSEGQIDLLDAQDLSESQITTAMDEIMYVLSNLDLSARAHDFVSAVIDELDSQ